MIRFESINKNKRILKLESGDSIPYDYLVVATGASHSYFGNDQWAPMAPGLTVRSAAHPASREAVTRR